MRRLAIISATMASNRANQPARVFQQFYSKLVKTLPMDDAVFTAELFLNDLLPGDLIRIN